jgi:hypothetical protein
VLSRNVCSPGEAAGEAYASDLTVVPKQGALSGSVTVPGHLVFPY